MAAIIQTGDFWAHTKQKNSQNRRNQNLVQQMTLPSYSNLSYFIWNAQWIKSKTANEVSYFIKSFLYCLLIEQMHSNHSQGQGCPSYGYCLKGTPRWKWQKNFCWWEQGFSASSFFCTSWHMIYWSQHWTAQNALFGDEQNVSKEMLEVSIKMYPTAKISSSAY
jgi:hypothetical protein